jgi:hypothetical protein
MDLFLQIGMDWSSNQQKKGKDSRGPQPIFDPKMGYLQIPATQTASQNPNGCGSGVHQFSTPGSSRTLSDKDSPG